MDGPTKEQNKRMKNRKSKTSILDLPPELIVHVCRWDAIKLVDMFNLAVSHPKLNDCLFGEPNSCLWKTKYVQKYGQLDEDEYEIVIDKHNSWKDEIRLRTVLDKAVSSEIMQLPHKFFRYKAVPYHLYPFSEELNSEYQAHRYYVLSATASRYKHLLSQRDKCEDEYQEVVVDQTSYYAHLFLVYSCHVYFGYKINDFLRFPSQEQTVERGFYLLSRWWCPTVDTRYRNINEHLNNVAINVYNLIRSTNPTHPLLEREDGLDQLIQRGKTNLNHDLFNESDSMFILDTLRQIVFSNNQFVCYCVNDIECLLLQQVIEQNKGSVLLVSVIYESVARRMGVKVEITASYVHNFITWSSSWPGNKHKNPTCFLIDIAGGGFLHKAPVCPVTRKLPEHIKKNSISELFWTFSKTIERIAVARIEMLKYVLDFHKLLRPDDPEVEFQCQRFHQYYDFCRCPLLRDPLNRNAPRHAGEKNLMPYVDTDWKDIFPFIPKTRGTDHDPKYSIGMVIDTVTKGNATSSNVVTKRGVIVGWTQVSSTKSLSNPTVYHVLFIPDCYLSSAKYQNPVIKSVWEGRDGKIRRQRLLRSYDYSFENIGKFFKYYSHQLCAFVPINDLAQLYPDDLSYTISKSMNTN